MQKILDIHIIFKDCAEVKTAEKTVRIISFAGKCETEFFRGEVLPGGVDVQVLGAAESKSSETVDCGKAVDVSAGCTTLGTVSARYILEGVDASGTPCKVYVENEGVIDSQKGMLTAPKVLTDSEELKWLHEAELKCGFETRNEEFHVIIYAK